MTLTAQLPGRFKLPLRHGPRPATQPAPGLRRSSPAFVLAGNRERSYSAREANMSKMSSPCALAVSSHGSARERNPISRWPSRSQCQPDLSAGESQAEETELPPDRADSPVNGRLVYRNRTLN